MVTRTIANTGEPVTDSGGLPVAGCVVSFRLVDANGRYKSTIDMLTGELVSSTSAIYATTDADGEFSVDLWPTDRGSDVIFYRCKIRTPGGQVLEDFIGPLVSGDLSPLRFSVFRQAANTSEPITNYSTILATTGEIITLSVVDGVVQFNI